MCKGGVGGKIDTTLGSQHEIGKESAVSDRRVIESKPVVCLDMRIKQRQKLVDAASYWSGQRKGGFCRSSRRLQDHREALRRVL